MMDLNGKGLFWTPSNGLAFNTRRRHKARPQPKPKRQRCEDPRKASLAEHMAEGGSISEWGRAHGIPRTTASRIWKTIVEEMGPQAV